MFICGSRSFIHQDEDNNGSDATPSSPPKRSKTSKSFCKHTRKDNINKNPYADRGLDKFLALLADLDNKKQKIYSQMGSEDISFIRFVYSSDSEHVKPIVVKVKNKNTKKDFLKHTSNSTITSNCPAAAADASDKSVDEILENREMVTPQQHKEELVMKDERRSGSFRLDNLRHPCCCFPVMLVLILLFLAIYGRSFVIVCTSIGWYLVPRIVEGSTSSSRSGREPKRKVSEKNIQQTQSQHDNVT